MCLPSFTRRMQTTLRHNPFKRLILTEFLFHSILKNSYSASLEIQCHKEIKYVSLNIVNSVSSKNSNNIGHPCHRAESYFICPTHGVITSTRAGERVSLTMLQESTLVCLCPIKISSEVSLTSFINKLTMKFINKLTMNV